MQGRIRSQSGRLTMSAAPAEEELPFTCDIEPADRSVDRLLACIGLLDDAAPLFQPGERVPRAGVLLALPALVKSGVFAVARDIYGTIGPAFYGLRTTLVATLLMALLRIKRPEALKEHSPADLGRLLGLDRAPEVKTLRRKLTRLASFGQAAAFGRMLASRRVASLGEAVGFLSLDGHVRVYHGKHALPKTHVARMRLAMPATSDYWVNDGKGGPLFVITAPANAGMVKMLPIVLGEVRGLVGDRRLTIVFDRGGWSPKLFVSLLAKGFDVLTCRKGRFGRVPTRDFARHRASLDGQPVEYVLADKKVRFLDGSLTLRQVTRLAEDDKHQTPIITSRFDLPAVEVAFRMFSRWKQEKFFKCLREEYALDALVDYRVEPDARSAQPQAPRPRRHPPGCSRGPGPPPRRIRRRGLLQPGAAPPNHARFQERHLESARRQLARHPPRPRTRGASRPDAPARPRRAGHRRAHRQALHREKAPHQPLQDGGLPGRGRAGAAERPELPPSRGRGAHPHPVGDQRRRQHRGHRHRTPRHPGAAQLAPSHSRARAPSATT